jgi:hypothetical protein
MRKYLTQHPLEGWLALLTLLLAACTLYYALRSGSTSRTPVPDALLTTQAPTTEDSAPEQGWVEGFCSECIHVTTTFSVLKPNCRIAPSYGRHYHCLTAEESHTDH